MLEMFTDQDPMRLDDYKFPADGIAGRDRNKKTEDCLFKKEELQDSKDNGVAE